jgi:acetyl esterase
MERCSRLDGTPVRTRLNPQAQAFIDDGAAAPMKRLTELPITAARQALIARRALQAPAEPVAQVDEILVAGADGMLPARVYQPQPGSEAPIIVYFHGGGWVVADLEHADRACRTLANASGCVVVSVDYRRAPETKFPGPLEDCYQATLWVAANSGVVGGDAARLCVAGDSAGGTLAAGVTLLARDRGTPAIVHQTLLYPPLVPEHIRPMPGQSDGTPFASYALYGSGYNLTRRDMEWYWNHYLATPEQAFNGYAAPYRAETLIGLPPALIVVPECDPLRDEGLAYADRLRGAGVSVVTTEWAGQLHALMWLTGVIDEATELIDQVGSDIAWFFAASARSPAPSAPIGSWSARPDGA